MDLVALADFNAVAAHGGFGAASRATGQAKATLSRRVQSLEAELGVRLIERGGRLLRLTEEGRALHARTAGLLADLEDIGLQVAAARGAPRGRLKVGIPAMLAGSLVGGIAARFVARHPQVKLEIVAGDDFVDPVVDGFDIVLRANPAPDSSLVGQCLSRDTLLVVAHPALRRPRGRNTPVVVPAVVHLNTPRHETWTIESEDGAITIQPEPVIRMSSIALIHGASLGGAGAALLPRHIVMDDLADGALVAWGSVPGRGVEVWALHASRRLVSAKVRLFVAALAEAFAERPGGVHGSGGVHG